MQISLSLHFIFTDSGLCAENLISSHSNHFQIHCNIFFSRMQYSDWWWFHCFYFVLILRLNYLQRKTRRDNYSRSSRYSPKQQKKMFEVKKIILHGFGFYEF